MTKYVFKFDELDQVKALGDPKGILGGKGYGLAEMTKMGLPVPPGFTITTVACNAYRTTKQLPSGMWDQVLAGMKAIESQIARSFGSLDNPLLVSCRSGAKFSMPGMMNTILNIGLNDSTVKVLEKKLDPRFVWDSYRRLLSMYGSTVNNIADEHFEEALARLKTARGAKFDTELTTDDLRQLVIDYKAVIEKHAGTPFPQDPLVQLERSIKAVFESWNSKRAIAYREKEKIPDDLGTAVNIVTMVFGNHSGGTSGTGVAFTRNPSTGEHKMMGEYLLNAQGEDVVAGIRNTRKIEDMATDLPKIYTEFMDITARMEKYFKDVQDVEFTIEEGKLWMLQTRNAKRTASAAIKIAVDMVNEGLITRDEALLRVKPEDIDHMLHPQFDPKVMKDISLSSRVFARGVNASPGAAVGQVFFDADTAASKVKEERLDVIMVRPFTKPDDIHGLLVSKGVLTSEGGATSHAAVVARQFGVPCIVGASAIKIDLEARVMRAGNIEIKEGEWISINGTTGDVYLGKIDLVPPNISANADLTTILKWADETCAIPDIRKLADGTRTRGLEVWANADYAADAERARGYGAMGLGLCRTEHMFFEPERIVVVQRMILAETPEDRQKALDELLPFQQSDFEKLFTAMNGLPTIIRLIDPPLHEFLPGQERLIEEVATLRAQKKNPDELHSKEHLLHAVHAMHEENPMMGLRGVRLSIYMPEIVVMQVNAIFRAASVCHKRGIKVLPEVMIPLTSTVRELEWIQPRLVQVAKSVMDEQKVSFAYKFGTMIEIPRAAVTAAAIARVAEFFSFGTNDLTQMTFGFSRDDAEKNFLVTYLKSGILTSNPFQHLDRDGVGELMKLAIAGGRSVRPGMDIGICGEVGGDPESIEFCHIIGNTYVSCSPFRVPIARLAAAHAALKNK